MIFSKLTGLPKEYLIKTYFVFIDTNGDGQIDKAEYTEAI
jgi:hypothetical protein